MNFPIQCKFIQLCNSSTSFSYIEITFLSMVCASHTVLVRRDNVILHSCALFLMLLVRVWYGGIHSSTWPYVGLMPSSQIGFFPYFLWSWLETLEFLPCSVSCWSVSHTLAYALWQSHPSTGASWWILRTCALGALESLSSRVSWLYLCFMWQYYR